MSHGPPDSRQSTSLFAALDSPLRVRLLDVLCAADGSLSLPTAAERTAARERTGSEGDGQGRQVERIRVSLRHVHLQKLSAAGLVDVDDEREEIRLTADADRIRRLLDTAAGLNAST